MLPIPTSRYVKFDERAPIYLAYGTQYTWSYYKHGKCCTQIVLLANGGIL